MTEEKSKNGFLTPPKPRKALFNGSETTTKRVEEIFSELGSRICLPSINFQRYREQGAKQICEHLGGYF